MDPNTSIDVQSFDFRTIEFQNMGFYYQQYTITQLMPAFPLFRYLIGYLASFTGFRSLIQFHLGNILISLSEYYHPNCMSLPELERKNCDCLHPIVILLGSQSYLYVLVNEVILNVKMSYFIKCQILITSIIRQKPDMYKPNHMISHMMLTILVKALLMMNLILKRPSSAAN